MRLLTFYLPQYHEIPENNMWWGDGFTEWTNVKKAESLYYNHYQPRVPLEKNYYNLLEPSTMEKQAEMAKKYGIYGFAYYHYWFQGKKLLEKPLEQMLKNPKVNIPFCLVWANEEWTKYWYGEGSKVIMKQRYGTRKDWEIHFEYLLPFFKDERYIKVDGKPMLVIYRAGLMHHGKQMIDRWNKLAKENGFEGLYVVGMYTWYAETSTCKWLDAMVDYEPCKEVRSHILKKRFIDIEKIRTVSNSKIFNRLVCNIVSYDRINKSMIQKKHAQWEYRGAFVGFDNTARAKKNGVIFEGSTPKKFKKYLSEQIKRSKLENKDYIFINAWNEWGEGCYLEPDERFGFEYLEAVKDALTENGEWR